MPIRGIDACRAGTLALAAALLLAACSSDGGTDNTPAETGTIAGNVAAGAEPVAGAAVALSGGSTGNRTTSAAGAYEFAGLSAGAYTVTLTVPAGFELAAGQTATRAATVTADQTTTVNFGLVEAPNTGSISGQVAAGAVGVAGAAIALSGAGTGNRTTAANGSYQFDALAPGSYTLTMTPPAGYELAAGQTAAKNATVTAGQNATVNWAVQSTGGGNLQIINLSGTSFSPANVQIAVGTTVRWVAQDGAHTVTPDNPGQAGAWTSTALSAGETFEHTFTVAGTYDYHCQPHQAVGMVGQIVVQ